MLNSSIIQGRLCAEPELRYTPNNVAVMSFTVAVNRNYDKDKTDFIECVAWKKAAELISKYFHKGNLIIVEGSIQTRTYEDKNGNKRKAVEVVANQVHFAESKAKDTQSDTPTFSAAPADDFEAMPDDDDFPF